jgi:flagellar basal-body rod modification protein FlgD
MAVSGVSSGSNATGVNKFADLSSESFVRIMTAELTSQDPLKPNDSSHILEQMSSLRQIESSTSLTTKLDQLVSQNQFSAASSLLGATVSGVSENGTRQSGTAVSIVRTSKGASLVLDTGYRIPVSNVDTVDVPVFDQTPTTPTIPTTPTTPTASAPVAAPARTNGVQPDEPGLQTGVIAGMSTPASTKR